MAEQGLSSTKNPSTNSASETPALHLDKAHIAFQNLRVVMFSSLRPEERFWWEIGKGDLWEFQCKWPLSKSHMFPRLPLCLQWASLFVLADRQFPEDPRVLTGNPAHNSNFFFPKKNWSDKQVLSGQSHHKQPVLSSPKINVEEFLDQFLFMKCRLFQCRFACTCMVYMYVFVCACVRRLEAHFEGRPQLISTCLSEAGSLTEPGAPQFC